MVTEYLAAIKSARTHKFHYDVALKPAVEVVTDDQTA
jgi:hypothetical protein